MHFRGKILPFDVKIKTPKALIYWDFRAFIKVCRKLPAAGLELIRASLEAFIYKGVDYKWVFNPTYYADKYPDLKAAFGYDGAKLFNHFTTYGMKEKRQAIATFNVEAYANNNPDLKVAYGSNWPAYYEHYCRYGHNEGRKAV